MGKIRLIESACLSLGLLYCPPAQRGSDQQPSHSQACWLAGRRRAQAKGFQGYWEEAHPEVTQKQGEHVDSQTGLSHCSSPGRPSSLDIRMTTCLGFGFSGKVSCSGEHALSGSKLESIAGGAGKSRQLFKASRPIRVRK